MPKQLFKGLFVVLFMVLIAGCASTNPKAGGITTKAYIADKDRVDQNMEGNFGYLAGTPKPEDRSKLKKTRKIYVMEFIKEPPEDAEVTTTTTETSVAPSKENKSQASREEARAEEPQGRTVELPNFDEERSVSHESATAAGKTVEEPAASTGEAKEYVIEKDDTLQKISKKFYNSYSKWPKIFEANKNVISNPNRLKPGVKIQIP